MLQAQLTDDHNALVPLHAVQSLPSAPMLQRGLSERMIPIWFPRPFLKTARRPIPAAVPDAVRLRSPHGNMRGILQRLLRDCDWLLWG